MLLLLLLQADLPIATDSSDSPAGSVSEHPCGLVPGDGGIVSGPAVLSCMSLLPLGLCPVSVDDDAWVGGTVIAMLSRDVTFV